MFHDGKMKEISGKLTCEIYFRGLEMDDGQTYMDVIFPDGFEGVMLTETWEVEEEEIECDD